MNSVFIDTSYLLALELKRDQNHEVAKKHWQNIAQTLPLFVTTSYVFDEIVTYFNSRGHHKKAVQVGNNLILSPSVQLVHVNESLFHEGWTYFKQHQDKDYSLTDCISFIVMEELRLSRAFTFDKHFVQAGFNNEP